MQSPRSILLHLDHSARAAERIQLARRLAETFDAHVVGQPCTTPALMRYPFALEGAAEVMAIMQDLDKEARARLQAVFTAAAGGSPRLQWTEPLTDGPWTFARRALYADLLLLGQRHADDPAVDELPGDFLPSLLVESGRPALVLPYAGPVDPLGRPALVAWKESREAARALSAALPFLHRADGIHAVAYGETAGESLRSLQAYLAEQGLDVVLHEGGREEGDAGGKLLSLAADLSAGLLVMGCYGHSRAREWVWGGATRTILQSMTLPVLMSH